ncbi:MAG: glycoside hydrolase family 28 protein [Gemmatimonadota bacterium]|nr:MAG: glycoside hydrolase family 28 protein [Gemmatimonadota bacterium]
MLSQDKKRCVCIGVILAGVIVFFSFLQSDTFASSVTHNVRDYGAVGDGFQLDTQAIQRAVDECAKGGGQVLLPGGTYLSGTIFMKNNVTLHISEGATLLGSTDIEDYPATTSPVRHYGDSWVLYSLIYGANLENIAITGRGLIDGQGGAYKVTTKKKPDRYMNRPYVIRFIDCRHVRVENIRMGNSAMWMQHYLGCEDVTIRGIKVYNHCNKNNDMIDIDGCRNVIISDCIGDTDDDAMTLKSTSERPCENVTITNCILSSHCNAIKMGTESHGGFRNITISNIVVKPSEHDSRIYGREEGLGGISLLIVDGGVMEGVTISNIRIEGTTSPIFMRLGNRGRTYMGPEVTREVGRIRNVKISNVVATGADTIGCSITGLPEHPIENLTLSNIHITFKGGGTLEDAHKTVPEKPSSYPESTIFGKLPAYGFYIRHANGVTLDKVNLAFEHVDARPALVCDDVASLDVSGLRALNPQSDESLIRLSDTQDAFISEFRSDDDLDLFLSVEGDKTDGIYLTGNDFSKVNRIFEVQKGAVEEEVKLKGNVLKQ